MTITEIARLAGVSVSTVSKIVNHKDESISAETRERVLKIVKEYNYRPYASAAAPTGRLGAIGILIREHSGALEQGIIAGATKLGYSAVFRSCSYISDDLTKQLNALIALHVDGIIVDDHDEDHGIRKAAQRANIPCMLMDNLESTDAPRIDYERFGFDATEALIAYGHTDIACLLGAGARVDGFFRGYKRCLFEHGIAFNKHLVFDAQKRLPIDSIATHAFSGIVTSHFHDALRLFQAASELHYEIPYDLSVVTLRGAEGIYPYPSLSSIEIPRRDLGQALASHLIANIEKTEPVRFDGWVGKLSNTDSLDVPYASRTGRIVTVGSINVDNYLMFDQLPHAGASTTSPLSKTFPGGKALNEAMGVARLGHAVAVVGRVGNDADADWLYATLKDCGVDTVGIQRTKGTKTGQAYIFVPRDGDSMVTIMAGANGAIRAADIKAQARLFSGASHCLVNTEIPLEAVRATLALAREHGVVTVVKPSAVSELPQDILQLIDILVPNEEELAALAPDAIGPHARAEKLLNAGVRNVVATLAAEGCLVVNSDGIHPFEAVRVDAIDSTGAGDAFIAALTSYLVRGYDLCAAARIANHAAALSVTRQGASPSFVDHMTLEAFVNKTAPELLIS